MPIHVRNIVIGLAVWIVVGGLFESVVGGLGPILIGFGLGIFTWYILSNLSSNRAVVNVSDADRSAALQAPPPAGSGLVFLYRDGFVGMAVGVECVVDAVTVAQLKSPRFTRIIVPAGEHTLAAGLKGFVGAQNRAAATPFSLAPGETAVFHLKISMGAVQNQIKIERAINPQLMMAKFSTMQMVAPEAGLAPAGSFAAPPPAPGTI